MDRTKLTQREKFIAFKDAFQTYSYHLNKKNYIAAYVVAFSILEDRVKAMYMVRKKERSQGSNPKTGFVRKLEYLYSQSDIDAKAVDEWELLAKDRNEKYHNAMWNLKEFSESNCKRILSAARNADNLRKKQKKLLDS